MNFVMEEVIDGATDGTKEVEKFFEDQDDKVKIMEKLVRPGGILLSVIGWYLLFSPVIALLSWIPLVGTLLGFIAKLAALVFALIVGTTVASLILGLAWLFFRPVIGVSLLTWVGVGIYFIFFFG
jgi:hypothetical protein